MNARGPMVPVVAEPLEVRRMLSAAVVKHELIVEGTAGDDVIAVLEKKGVLRVVQNGQTQTFAKEGVRKIRVRGLAGDDQVTVHHTEIDLVIKGGAGNDTLAGSDGRCTLFGEDGDDTLMDSAGITDFRGGWGIDTADFSVNNTPLRITIDDLANDGARPLPIIDEVIILPAKKGSGVTVAHNLKPGQDNVQKDMENVIGGQGNDLIHGSTRSNVLDGRKGRDTIAGFAGADTMIGGDGFDEVLYSERHAAVSVTFDDLANDGEAGEGDLIIGMEGARTGDGDDTIIGTGKDEEFYGGRGDDLIEGRAGNDRIFGDVGSDTLLGGDGDDLLSGGGENDSLVGGQGGDTFFGGTGDDVLLGGVGRDRLVGDEGRDTLDGGDDQDTLLGGAGVDQLISDVEDEVNQD